MTFVIISGGIDLSVGSVIGFSTVFIALATERLGAQSRQRDGTHSTLASRHQSQMTLGHRQQRIVG